MPGPGPAGKAAAAPAAAHETTARRPREATAPWRHLGAALGNQATAQLLARQVVRHTPGQPLPAAAQAGLERRFGADLSSVRVHHDPGAAASVGALAYTIGEHIVLGAGDGDRGLLEHEVTHVLQQRANASGSARGRLEGEAGRAAGAGDGPVTVHERSRVGLARADAPGPNVLLVGQGQTTVVTVDGTALLECTATGPQELPAFETRAVGAKGGPLVIIVVHVPATSVTVYPEGKQGLLERGYTDVRVVDSVLREAAPGSTAPAAPPRRRPGPAAKPPARRKPPAKPAAAEPPSTEPSAVQPQPAEEPPAPEPDVTPPAPDDTALAPETPAPGPPPLPPPGGELTLDTTTPAPPPPPGRQAQPGQAAAGPSPAPTAGVPGAVTTPARPPARRAPAGTGRALVDEFSGWFTRDYAGLGTRLAGHARGGQLDVIDEALDQVRSTERDDVSLALVSRLSDGELDEMLRTRQGKVLSLRLYDELTSGFAGADEQAQAQRLLQARFRSAKPGAALDPAMKVIPFEGIGFTKVESASLSVQRLADGRLSVRSHLANGSNRRYARNLSPAFLAGLPETFDPDEIIGVYLVDEDRLVTAPAMFLLQLSNAETTKAYSMIGQALLTGLTLGAGAEVGAAEVGAENAAARTGAARLLAGGARAVAVADRVATVVGTAGVLIDDHRGLIIRNFGDRGREGLEVWSKIEAVTAVYGVARGGAALVQLAARMRTVLASWRALRAAAREETAETRALDATIRETEAALAQIDAAPAEANAAAETSAAVPPNRAAEVPPPNPAAEVRAEPGGAADAPLSARPRLSPLPKRQRQALGFGAANDNAVPGELSAAELEQINKSGAAVAENDQGLIVVNAGRSSGGGTRRVVPTPAPSAGTRAVPGTVGRVISGRPTGGTRSGGPPSQPFLEPEEGLPSEVQQEFSQAQDLVPAEQRALSEAGEGDLSLRERIQPPHLPEGVVIEEREKLTLGLDLTKPVTWRPGEKDINSTLFKVMVGEPEYTPGGKLRGVIMDGPALEIKSGDSRLDSTYQLRLMAYRAVISNEPLTIRTSRHVEPEFRQWLTRWGVDVKPLASGRR